VRTSAEHAITILGVSPAAHDPAAVVVRDGDVVAATSASSLGVDPDAASARTVVEWCLDAAGPPTHVALAGRPVSSFDQALRTAAPGATVRAAADWWTSRVWADHVVDAAVRRRGARPPRWFVASDRWGAAAAFYPSPHGRAAILTLGAASSGRAASIAWGAGHRIEPRVELRSPGSVAWLCATVAAFCGLPEGAFTDVAALAFEGTPDHAARLRDDVLNVAVDGAHGTRNGWRSATPAAAAERLAELLSLPSPSASAVPRGVAADVAASARSVVEELVVAMAAHACELTGEAAWCVWDAGVPWVADVTRDPARPAGDGWAPELGALGPAVGAALWLAHDVLGIPRPDPPADVVRVPVPGVPARP